VDSSKGTTMREDGGGGGWVGRESRDVACEMCPSGRTRFEGKVQQPESLLLVLGYELIVVRPSPPPRKCDTCPTNISILLRSSFFKPNSRILSGRIGPRIRSYNLDLRPSPVKN
jgi:hypothetical protein